MANVLNHLKRGESLENKQLVLINSNEKDLAEQSTSSFTYTFSQPVKRISRMDVMNTKIPKSYYNINNDNATMTITTERFTDTITDVLVVDDVELKNNNILATNVIDGTVNKSNTVQSISSVLITNIITKNTFFYVSGIFTDSIIYFTDYNGVKVNPLTNVGKNDVFIAKYTINQEMLFRFRIGGLDDDTSINISITDNFIFVSGVFKSAPLTFYDIFDTEKFGLSSDGNYNGFLAKYTIAGEFLWAVRILGIDFNNYPILVNAYDINNSVYVAGTFKSNLTFNSANNTSVDIEYSGPGSTHGFIAQYNYAGLVIGINSISDCVIRSIVMNSITFNIIIGAEYFNNIGLYKEYLYPGTPAKINLSLLPMIGVQNLLIAEFNNIAGMVNRMRIGGSNFESYIKLDVLNNVLCVSGLYSSNPLSFYDSSDILANTVQLNGTVNNLFISKYTLSTLSTDVIWSTNIYSINDMRDPFNVSVSTTGDILVVGNYTSLLKFNNINGQLNAGLDLINNFSRYYTFIAKYNSVGMLQYRSYIETDATANVYTIGTSIDAHSNNVLICGQFSANTILLYNSDNKLAKTIDNTNIPGSYLNNGYIISYINNVNNYNIDITTLGRRIISRTLNGIDLNYTINNNAFSQQLGFSSSTILQAMVFGSVIPWTTVDINSTNNIISIEFSIGNKITQLFDVNIITFKIINFGNYTPYNLTYELNKVIYETLVDQKLVVISQINNFIKYDKLANIFYFIFSINGTFRILTPLGSPNLNTVNGLNMPVTVSKHCAISETYIVNEDVITIADNSKLTIKVKSDITETRFNNVSFNTAFPYISGSSGILNIGSQLNKIVTLTSGSNTRISTDLQTNDTIEFDTPWTYSDTNEVVFQESLNWSSIASNGDNTIITAVVNGGNIYTSYNSGISWSLKETIRAWSSVAMSQNSMYQTAVVDGGPILVSTDGGVSWVVKESIRSWRGISVSRSNTSTDGMHQTAVAQGNRIYVSHNYGNTWTAKGPSYNWLSIDISSNGMNQVAAIFGGSLWWSNDGGDIWNIAANTVNNWQSVSMSNDASVIIAVTILEYWYKSTDFGITWVKNTLSIGKILTQIKIAKNSPNYISAIGNAGSIYTTNDSGLTWVSNNSTESWASISISDNGINQMAIVNGGGIYSSSNNGITWIELTDIAPWNSIAISSDGKYQMASQCKNSIFIYTPSTPTDGSIWQSVDNGVIWNKANIVPGIYPIKSPYAVAMSDDGMYRFFIYSSINNANYGLAKSSDYGITWNYAIISGTLYGVVSSIDGKYVTIVHRNVFRSKIFVSTDYGVNFTNTLGPDVFESHSVSMNSDGSLQMFTAFNAKVYIYISTDYWNTFTTVLPFAAETNWIHVTVSRDSSIILASRSANTGLSPSTMFMSYDKGVTWSANTNFANDSLEINHIAMSSQGTYINVIVARSPLYRSNNKGQSFVTTDINRRYACSSISTTGKNMGVVVNNGGIFYSNDFGNKFNIKKRVYNNLKYDSNWTALGMSSNGKFIVCAALDSTIMFSKDYGKSFTDLNDQKFWLGAAISDNGQKIVGMSSKQAGDYGYVKTSWDGGNTFYSTNSLNNYFYWSYLGFLSLSMNRTGSVVMISGLDSYESNNSILISLNSVAPISPALYDISWAIDVSFSNNIPRPIHPVSSPQISSIAMNSAGTIRYAGTTADVYNYLISAPKFYKWVSSTISPQPSTPSYNIWFDTNINVHASIIACSSDGSKVTIGIRNSQLRYSSDYGVTFSELRGPSIGTYSDFPKISMNADGTVQALVSNNTLYVSYDNWVTNKVHGISRSWTSVAVSDDGNYINAVSAPGWLYQSFDRGNTFGVQQTNIQPYKICISGLARSQAIASMGRELFTSFGTYGNTMITGSPFGVWSDIAIDTFGISSISVSTYGLIYVSDLSSGWIVGGPTPLITNRWLSCAISGSGEYRLVADYSGNVYRSVGFSINSAWTQVTIPVGLYKSCSINSDGTRMAIANYGGFIYISNDFGVTWLAKGISGLWQSISVPSGSLPLPNIYLFAAMYDGPLYVLSDTFILTNVYNVSKPWQSSKIDKQGINFTAVALNDYIYTSNSNLIFTKRSTIQNWVSNDISIDGGTQVAVSFNKLIYKSWNFGVTWSSQICINEISDLAISDDGITQMVCINGGSIYISTNSGNTWIIAGSANNWRAVSMNSNGTIKVAAAYNDTVYMAINNNNFVAQVIPLIYGGPNNKIVDIDMSADGTNILVATEYGSIFLKSGVTWVNVGPDNIVWSGVAVSNSTIQYACSKITNVFGSAGQLPIYKSTDNGATWNPTTSQSLLWFDIDTSANGLIVAAVVNGGNIWVSKDAGVTWTSRGSIQNWVSISVTDDGIKQIAAADDGLLYVSTNSGDTWTSVENVRKWRRCAINATGSIQIACTTTRVLSHQFGLNTRINFSVNNLDSSTAYTSTVSSSLNSLSILDNFNLGLAVNFTTTRTTLLNASNLYIPPSNYTAASLISTANSLIYTVDPTWGTPVAYGFTYNSTNNKISFTPKNSGSNIIVSTELLKLMGFINIPNTVTGGTAIVATNSLNLDFSGPSNIFIQSKIIGELRKNKTAYSKNKKLQNIIAPLTLNTTTNNYETPFPIEIFLSKKADIDNIDIQIVDEYGKIVNLNGSATQVNFYFYSS